MDVKIGVLVRYTGTQKELRYIGRGRVVNMADSQTARVVFPGQALQLNVTELRVVVCEVCQKEAASVIDDNSRSVCRRHHCPM